MILTSADVKRSGLLISDEGRALVEATAEPIIHVISEEFGQAYNAVMPGFECVAGNFVFYIKNIAQNKRLNVERLEFNTEENVVFKVHKVTGVASGATVIVPTNLKLGSTNAADVICLGGGVTVADLDALAITDLLGVKYVPAFSNEQMNFGEALSLGQNDAIIIETDVAAAGGIVYTECIFYFE